MLMQIISTPLANLWYEIWRGCDEDGEYFTALRYDAEIGYMTTVATEWRETHAEIQVRYDMARLGVA